jgi:hypothetical protein
MTARQGLSLPHNTQVFRVDGTTQIASTSSQLFNDSAAALTSSILLDENGTSVASTNVWVGDTINHCSNWSDGTSGSSAIKGDNQSTNNLWLSNGTSTCDNAYRLYCIGQ